MQVMSHSCLRILYVKKLWVLVMWVWEKKRWHLWQSDVSRYFSGEKNCRHLAMVDEKGVSEWQNFLNLLQNMMKKSMMLSSHKFFTEHTACCEIWTQIKIFSDPYIILSNKQKFLVGEKGVSDWQNFLNSLQNVMKKSMMLCSHKFFTEHTACCEIRTQITIFSDP